MFSTPGKTDYFGEPKISVYPSCITLKSTAASQVLKTLIYKQLKFIIFVKINFNLKKKTKECE